MSVKGDARTLLLKASASPPTLRFIDSLRWTCYVVGLAVVPFFPLSCVELDRLTVSGTHFCGCSCAAALVAIIFFWPLPLNEPPGHYVSTAVCPRFSRCFVVLSTLTPIRIEFRSLFIIKFLCLYRGGRCGASVCGLCEVFPLLTGYPPSYYRYFIPHGACVCIRAVLPALVLTPET